MNRCCSRSFFYIRQIFTWPWILFNRILRHRIISRLFRNRVFCYRVFNITGFSKLNSSLFCIRNWLIKSSSRTQLSLPNPQALSPDFSQQSDWLIFGPCRRRHKVVDSQCICGIGLDLGAICHFHINCFSGFFIPRIRKPADAVVRPKTGEI